VVTEANERDELTAEQTMTKFNIGNMRVYGILKAKSQTRNQRDKV
jgi:hypothetical protein